MSMYARPLIINACLTGMVTSRKATPHVPITPEEIVQDALAVAERGACIVHLHARGPDGLPTWDPAIYAEFLGAVREHLPDLVLCVSTSGRQWNEREKRSAVLQLDGICKPDMASLTLGSLNFLREASVNRPQDIEYLLETMYAAGIRPELEIFDLGMADLARHWYEEGKLRPPLYANILLGNRGTAAATPANLVAIVDRLPPGTIWAAAGIGRAQLPVNAMAVAMGGNVRVGLEDNIFFDGEKSRLASNSDLVSRVVDLAKLVERRIARPEEVRAMLGLDGAADKPREQPEAQHLPR